MAKDQKKASQLNAFLVFVDESGIMMAPLLRRTWSPQGQTPVLYQKTASHKKVSVIAALCLTPQRHRFHLYFRLYPDVNINAPAAKEFLYHLVSQINAPIVLIWDRFQPHRSRQVRDFIQDHEDFYSFFFPPYAPELNPVEYVWAYAKTNSMANLPLFDLPCLTTTTRSQIRALQRKQNLLKSFLKKSGLSLRLI